MTGPNANKNLVAPTPISAVLSLTLLASIGTGVIWNGVPFIAKAEYGYNQTQTLLMYLVIGLTYISGAMTAARFLKFIERWMTARTLLVLILIIQSVICLGPLFVKAAWILWVVVGITSLLASFLWPIIESYLTAGRHGREMRRAIGWWNVVWTSSVAASLWFMAPFLKEDALFAIVALGGFNVVALITLYWFKRNPGMHDEEMSEESITSEYPFLLRSVRILLPLSYVLNSALGPLLPYLLNRLEVDIIWQTPTAATWMVVRVVAMALMWWLGFWHGRWGTLLLGGTLITSGFALIVLAPSLAILLIGFGLFGAGMGVIYYAALYYAMSIGKAQVDASGKHESLIGIGYAIGPAAGLFGMQLPGLLQMDFAEGLGIVYVICGLVLLAAIPAIKPYWKAKAIRNELTNWK